MSANTAVPMSDPRIPIRMGTRLRRAAPIAIIAGIASVPHHSGSEVSIRSSTPGISSPMNACA